MSAAESAPAGVITDGSANVLSNNLYDAFGVLMYASGSAATQWRFEGRFVEEEGLVAAAGGGGDVLVARGVAICPRGREGDIPPGIWKFGCMMECVVQWHFSPPICLEFCTALFYLCIRMGDSTYGQWCLVLYNTVCGGQ